MPHSQASQALARLLEIMDRLRAPEGCPWDAAQTPESLCPYIVEEAHEVIEAIEAGEPAAICEELGDLLLQVVFQSRIFEERGHFAMADVCEAISNKLVRRHPHVFAGQSVRDEKSLAAQWERIKAEEKGAPATSSLLDGVPRSLSALHRARKISEKASRAGFDWPDTAGILLKVREEWAELEAALSQRDHNAIEAELGDLLFSLVNLARFLDFEAEGALNKTISRFQKRFQHIEMRLKQEGVFLQDCSPEKLDAIWEEAKQLEKTKNSRTNEKQ
ncbi:MAG: nucleoside triphosphate pyrophosphohydrolase [Desulfuromonadales bacterium]